MSSHDVEIHLKAYDEATAVIQNVGNNLSITCQNIEGDTQRLADMTTSATTQMSNGYSQAAGQIQTSNDEIQGSMDTVSTSSGNLAGQWTSLAGVGMGLAGSAMAMYSSQIMVDRANVMVEQSALAVEKAQTRYNDAVQKFGSNSAEAETAQETLTAATDRHSVAVERAQRATDMYALTIGMTVVTGVATAIKVIEAMSAALFTEDAVTGLTVASKIAAAVASAAHAVAEGIETAATWLLVSATATEVSLLTLGVGLVIAATAVVLFMATAQGAAAAQTNDLNASLVGVNSSLTQTQSLLNIHIGVMNDFADAVSAMNDQVKANSDELTGLYKNLSDADAAWGKLRVQVDEYLIKGEKVPVNLQAQADAAQRDYEAILNQITALEDANGALKDHLTNMELDQKAAQLLYDTEITSSTAFQNSVIASADAIQVAFTRNAGNLQSQADATRIIIQNFASQWGITYDEAEKTLRKGVDDLIKDQQKATDEQAKLLAKQEADLQKHADVLNTFYTDKFVKPTQQYQDSLSAVAARVDTILNNQAINITARLAISTGAIQDFANKWHISWDQAEKDITNAANSISKTAAAVPQALDQELVKNAQDKFAEFQKCITGKSLTLHTDVAGNVKAMADNITGLIRNGLVGEAQNEMQAYVNCNTNKVGDMVLQINKDMKDLTASHNKDIADMKAYAEIVTGAEKDAVLAQIDAMNAGYIAKMSQLRDWQNQLMQQMVNNVTVKFMQMTQIAIGQAQHLGDRLVGTSIWTDLLKEMVKQSDVNLRAVEERFTKMGANVEKTIPSATPVKGAGGIPGAGNPCAVSIQINSPLVVIEGNADKETADLAAQQVLTQLKAIVVEPSSYGVTATQKRIRKGALF
jgi:hypothetical protein